MADVTQKRLVSGSDEREAAASDGGIGVMTVEEIEQQVASIDVTDDEAAHANEDAIWEGVLRAIAAGHQDAAALATAALRTRELFFSRWYA